MCECNTRRVNFLPKRHQPLPAWLSIASGQSSVQFNVSIDDWLSLSCAFIKNRLVNCVLAVACHVSQHDSVRFGHESNLLLSHENRSKVDVLSVALFSPSIRSSEHWTNQMSLVNKNSFRNIFPKIYPKTKKKEIESINTWKYNQMTWEIYEHSFDIN